MTCRTCEDTFTIPERAISRVYQARGEPLPDQCPRCRRREKNESDDRLRPPSPLSRDIHELRLLLADRSAELAKTRDLLDTMERRVRRAEAEAAALRVARDAALRVAAWGGLRTSAGPSVEAAAGL